MISRFINGFSYIPKGIIFIYKNKWILKYSLIPFCINLLIFTIGFLISYSYFNKFVGNIFQFDTLAQGVVWYLIILHYLILFLKYLGLILLKILGIALIVLLNSVISFLIIGNIITSPFYEIISQKVELIYLKNDLLQNVELSFLKDLKRVIVEEIKKSLFFAFWGIFFFVLSYIPIINIVSIPLGTIFTTLFLGLSYLDIPMERRKFLFKQKKELFLYNKFIMLGFGTAITLSLMIPIFNLIIPTIAVIGGTLLFTDIEREKLT